MSTAVLFSSARRRGWIVAAILVLGCIGAFVWVEWGAGSSATTMASPVREVVTGVVVTEGGPPVVGGGSDARAVPTAPLLITGTTSAGKRLVLRTTTDGSGRFHLRLPPGRYRVAAEIFPGAAVQPHRVIVVREGRPLNIRITGHVV